MAKQQDGTENLGFIAPADPTAGGAGEAGDVFGQLLDGQEDDDQAVELSTEQLANMGECYRRVAELTREVKRQESKLTQTKAALTQAKLDMESVMKAHGTKQFKGVGDDGACSLGSRYDTKVTDPKAFSDWVVANHPELLTVMAQTRTKFIRENYKDRGIPTDSEEFPPGIEASERSFLQVRGVKDTDEV